MLRDFKFYSECFYILDELEKQFSYNIDKIDFIRDLVHADIKNNSEENERNKKL